MDFKKIADTSMIAGALYACSKQNKFTNDQKMAYQFLHFKIAVIVEEYFKLAYRVIGQQDNPYRFRNDLIDKHMASENNILKEQETGVEAINRKEITCDQVGEVAGVIWQTHKGN